MTNSEAVEAYEAYLQADEEYRKANVAMNELYNKRLGILTGMRKALGEIDPVSVVFRLPGGQAMRFELFDCSFHETKVLS